MSLHVDRKLGDPAAFVKVGKLLQQGVSSAKSIDTSGIKAQLPYWWASLAPESPQSLRTRVPVGSTTTSLAGFFVQLSSIGMTLSKPLLITPTPCSDQCRIQKKLQEGTAIIDGRAVNGGDWPNFLYMIPYDADMPWVGCFKAPFSSRLLHAIRQRTVAWNDKGHYWLHRLHCNTGTLMPSTLLPSTTAWLAIYETLRTPQTRRNYYGGGTSKLMIMLFAPNSYRLLGASSTRTMSVHRAAEMAPETLSRQHEQPTVKPPPDDSPVQFQVYTVPCICLISGVL
ncbi:hypothetical protein IMY05_C4868000300 [Salix suchowensis]|nr:hypothetical protein IMY05_C4868000300 [Salix suchowensis]